MKKAGKITIGLICLVLAIGITWTFTPYAKAATSAQTFVLPSSPDITYDTNTYIMLYDRASGNLMDDALGTTGATWAGAAIATAAHGTYTEAWIATIPPLDTNKEYVMVVWSGTNYANTDTFQAGPWLYDPENNITFTDTNPIRRKNVGVRTQ